MVLQALSLQPSIFKLMLKAGKTVTLLGQTVSPSPLLSLALSQKPNFSGGASLERRERGNQDMTGEAKDGIKAV